MRLLYDREYAAERAAGNGSSEVVIPAGSTVGS